MIPEKSSVETVPAPILENSIGPTQRRARWGLLILAAMTLTGGVIFWPRKSHALPAGATDAPAVVAASLVTREEIAREIVFDSELRPYQEIDLHAKVAGYVQAINVDVGDHVKQGQVIAQLELPEAQNDLDRALAAQRRAAQQIRRAQVAWDDAHVSLSRLTAIEKAQPNLIAQQDLDTATAKERAAEADLAAAKEQESGAIADVDKLKTMLQYARITAPFDGVVTKRYADKGALIQAGTSSSTQAMPLIRLSQNNFLRLVFPVSASFVSAIKQGDLVEVSIPGLSRKVEAKISRSSQKVDFSTRTMEAEVDIENPEYSLIPGMYAAVRVRVERKNQAIVAPIATIARKGDSATVYLITKDGIIEERSVKLGLESPFKIEILSGLAEGDMLLMGNRSSVNPGQHVTPKVVSTEPIPVS
jgi:RND family efflux transporter MFP subunit